MYVKLRRGNWLLGLVMMLTSTMLIAQSRAPKYSNEFLNLGVGARGMALSGAVTALSDDATSGYWNPAALRRQSAGQQLSLMHAAYFGGIANYDVGAFALHPDEKSSLAITAIRFAVDDIPDTRFLFDANGAINYDRIRFFSASDFALLLSYARSIDKLGGINIGTSTKIIRRRVGEFGGAWGFGIDAALDKSWNKWSAALVLKDVFGTFNAWSHNTEALKEIYAVTGNELPVNSMEVTLPRAMFGGAWSSSFADNLFQIKSGMDLEITFDGKRNTLIKSEQISIDPRAGFELGFKEVVFVRTGIGRFQQLSDINGNRSWQARPTAGLGFVMRDVQIDYAMTDVANGLDGLYSHIFSIKVNFNAKANRN